MTPRRLPVGLLVMVPMLFGLGLYAFTLQGEVPPPDEEAAGGAVTPLAAAAYQPSYVNAEYQRELELYRGTLNLDPTPSPTQPSTGYAERHGPFHAGARVRVDAGVGECLNARSSPSLTGEYAAVNICLPDGFEGLLTNVGSEADGHWWWQLAGAGFVAEDYLVYLGDVSTRDALAPQFSDLPGHIAFIREASIWVMRPDGSGQRQLVASGDNRYPQDIRWSPDGSSLTYNLPDWATGVDGGRVDAHVVDLEGNDRLLAAGAAAGGWSPDGARLALVLDAGAAQMGGGARGAPGWLDVASGEVYALGDPALWDDVWQPDLPAFNHDGTLVLVTRYAYDDTTQTEDRAFIVYDLAGNERARIIDQPEARYYSPVWAPESNRISFHILRPESGAYAVYDIDQAAIVAEAAAPARDPNRGGRCGGGDMWRTAWSRDGRIVLYSYTDGLAVTNGVWAWDVLTGEQRLVSVFGPDLPSAGPLLSDLAEPAPTPEATATTVVEGTPTPVSTETPVTSGSLSPANDEASDGTIDLPDATQTSTPAGSSTAISTVAPSATPTATPTPNAATESFVVFSDYQHIFIATSAGGLPVFITDGRSPVWSPR